MNERDLPLGIHHVTAMTSDVVKNYDFFTEVLLVLGRYIHCGKNHVFILSMVRYDSFVRC